MMVPFLLVASQVTDFFISRSFVDQCSSSIDFSRDSDRARSMTRVSACLTALEGVLKGSSSFSPIRRYVHDSQIFDVCFTIALTI